MPSEALHVDADLFALSGFACFHLDDVGIAVVVIFQMKPLRNS